MNIKRKIEFSKKLLIVDYIIAICIIIFLAVCGIKNYIYMSKMQELIIETGYQLSLSYPFDLTNLTVILTVWIGQLAISSTAYYIMCKSDHKVQLPMIMLNNMPDDIKDKVDMTTIITTVLNTTDN